MIPQDVIFVSYIANQKYVLYLKIIPTRSLVHEFTIGNAGYLFNVSSLSGENIIFSGRVDLARNIDLSY